jgi:TolB protein
MPSMKPSTRLLAALLLLAGAPAAIVALGASPSEAAPASPASAAQPATAPAAPGAASTAPAAPAPGSDVTLFLRDGQRSRLRLAFPAFTGRQALPAGFAEAAAEMEQTLRADLETTRLFEIQGPQELSVLALTGDPTRDFELYRSLGNEVVLLSELKSEGDKLILEARIYDLKSGQSIVGKRYRGGVELARRIAHTFADEVVLYFTGKRGIALTSIAFTSDRDGSKEIYLMDYDGRNQRRITAHKSISMSPAWSPIGDRVAYVSFFSGTPGIYFVDLASGAKRPVITSGSFNTAPSVSPDGSRVAFSRSIEGQAEIFVSDAGGGGLRRLTHSNGIDTNPAWGPNGREIAFTSSRAGSPQVYVMDAEGANARRISFDGSYNDGAAWSPDGTLLAYASRRGPNDFEIAVTNLVTLETRLLTGGTGSKETPSFSPDGRRLVFHLSTGRLSQLYAVDVDGTHLTQLTYSGRNMSPDWSGYPR